MKAEALALELLQQAPSGLTTAALERRWLSELDAACEALAERGVVRWEVPESGPGVYLVVAGCVSREITIADLLRRLRLSRDPFCARLAQVVRQAVVAIRAERDAWFSARRQLALFAGPPVTPALLGRAEELLERGHALTEPISLGRLAELLHVDGSTARLVVEQLRGKRIVAPADPVAPDVVQLLPHASIEEAVI